MSTKKEGTQRYHFTKATASTGTPQHERGLLQQVGEGVWLAATPPPDLGGFAWVVTCVPAGTDPGWRVDELDAIVARVVPARQAARVLFMGDPADGLAACAAAACVLAAGRHEHVEAALGFARWPGRKVPKPVRCSLRDWWESCRGLLPPSVDSFEALCRVPAFDGAWDLLAMAPFNARELYRYASFMREGLGEATPYLVGAGPDEEAGEASDENASNDVMAPLVADFAEKAHGIVRELAARDPSRGEALIRRWWAWYARLAQTLGG